MFSMLLAAALVAAPSPAPRSTVGLAAADIAAYDEVHRHILRMAHALSDGIVKQFPSRFN